MTSIFNRLLVIVPTEYKDMQFVVQDKKLELKRSMAPDMDEPLQTNRDPPGNGNNGNNRNSKRHANRQYSKLKVKEE